MDVNLALPSSPILLEIANLRLRRRRHEFFSLANWKNSREIALIPEVWQRARDVCSEMKVIVDDFDLHDVGPTTESNEQSVIWDSQLTNGRISDLAALLRNGRLDEVVPLLLNFWQIKDGTIGATYYGKRKRSEVVREALKTVFMFSSAKQLFGVTPSDACLPSLVGNPPGFVVRGVGGRLNANGVRYSVDSLEIASLASAGAVVLEIGGGHGALAAMTLSREPTLTYVDCDLFEMLLVAYFYLRMSLSETMRVKFVTSNIRPESFREVLREADVVLLPSVFKALIPLAEPEVVFNSYSFAEMSRKELDDYKASIDSSGAKFIITENFSGSVGDARGLIEGALSFEGFVEKSRRLPLDPDNTDCLRVVLDRSKDSELVTRKKIRP